MKLPILLLFLWLILFLSFSLFALDVNKAVKFLKTQFVKEVGLLRASTVGEDGKTCYIASDNLLAAAIFKIFGDELFHEIVESLSEFNGGADGRHEILLGVNIEENFYVRHNELVKSVFGRFGNRVGPGKVVYELPVKSAPLISCDKYADLIVYKALISYYNGAFKNAFEYFKRLVSLWDGHGFKDASFPSTNLYETYKLSLAIYLYKLLSLHYSQHLKQYDPIISNMKKIVDLMQDLNGGVITDYKYDDFNHEYIPIGDVNVETTCMSLLAYVKKIFKRQKLSKIEFKGNSIKVGPISQNCVAIVLKSSELEKAQICDSGCREVKRYSNDVQSIILWLNQAIRDDWIKVKLWFSNYEDLSRDLTVYAIELR